MRLRSFMPRLRLIPLSVSMAALAFGAHAGEAVQKITEPKVAPPQITPPQTRSEIRFRDEIKQVKNNTNDKDRQIDLRERLAEATERRIDAKLSELRTRENAQTQQQAAKKEESNQQLLSLIKVYESMKPKEAAAIFEKLDISVQVAVASHMKEQKIASIMAKMSPDAAKALTMELANQAKIGQKS